MHYKCTKATFKELAVDPSENIEIDKKLFTWHVKVGKIGRRKITYAMHGESRFVVILYGMVKNDFKNFDKLLRESIQQILEECGVSTFLARKYVSYSKTTTFSSGSSKKELGALNIIGRDTEFMFDEFHEDSLLQNRLSVKRNNYIVKNDDGVYVVPSKTMKMLLHQFFSNNQLNLNIDEIASCMFMNDLMGMKSYLNLSDGSISFVEEFSSDNDDLEYDEMHRIIPTRNMDFYSQFTKFMRNVTDTRFIEEYSEIIGTKGYVKKVKNLLNYFPDVQKEWYQHKDDFETNEVHIWLRRIGLKY